MIIEATVASEAQNRFIWQRTLYSQRRGKGPAEGTGAANASLFWFVELDPGSCPAARVACIRHYHGVVGYETGDLLAEPSRPHGHCIRIALGRYFRTPFLNVALHVVNPFLSGFRQRRRFDKLPEGYFGVSHEADDVRIIFS